MYIVVMLLSIITMSYGMQSCSLIQKQFIDAYLQTTFNIPKPKQFNVEYVCQFYTSAHLKGNIDGTINIIQKQAFEKSYSPIYLDSLKKTEYQLLYGVFLKNVSEFLPKIVKKMKRHCTLPLSDRVQTMLLRRFWYAHWALILPTKIEKLYDKGVVLPFIAGQQNELLKNFKTECLQHKNPYISKVPISFYQLCNIFAEKFLLIACEIKNTKHLQIIDQNKMQKVCENAAEMCKQLPEIIDSLNPLIVTDKSKNGIVKKQITAKLFEFWENFWTSPFKRPNYKKNITKNLKIDVQNMINRYQAALKI